MTRSVRWRRDGQWRDDDAPDLERVERGRDPDDVDQRVVGAQLLQEEVRERYAVHASLASPSLASTAVARARTPSASGARSTAATRSSGSSVRRDFEPLWEAQGERPEAGAHHLRRPDLDPPSQHGGDGVGDRFRGRADVQERREQHVARRADDDVDVEGPHARAPFAARAIIEAMYPARRRRRCSHTRRRARMTRAWIAMPRGPRTTPRSRRWSDTRSRGTSRARRRRSRGHPPSRRERPPHPPKRASAARPRVDGVPRRRRPRRPLHRSRESAP